MPKVKGLSTYQVFLMLGTLDAEKGTNDYAKLVDIVSFPDLQPEPETIDITTLTDGMRQFIPGIKDPGGNLVYAVNYTPENYKAIEALNDGQPHAIAVYIGADATGAPDGHNGKFSYDAYVQPQLSGGGVNEKISMNCITTPTSDVTVVFPTA